VRRARLLGGQAGGAALLLFAAALALPGLGSYGLWQPDELRVGEAAAVQARELSRAAPGLRAWWPALGIAAGGVSERAARLPLALGGIALVMAAAWAGAALGGRRAGLLGGAVLAVTPLYVLQARQLTSDVPLMLGGALVLGGLARLRGATRDRDAWIGLAAAVCGVALGAAAGGVLLGVLAPLGAGLAAHALAGAPPGPGARWRRRALVGLSVLAAAAGVLVAASSFQAGIPSWLLGGTPTGASSRAGFERLIRALGFGLFPFGALALLALVRPLAGRDTEAETDVDAAAAAAGRFGELALLLAAALALAGAVLTLHLTGEVRAAAVLPAAALAVGRLLDQALAGRRPPLLVAAFAALGAVLVGRDLSQGPEDLVAGQLAAKLSWPLQLGGARWLLALGVLAGAGMLAVAAPGAAGVWARVRRAAPGALLALAAVFALVVAHRLIPALSLHLSQKQLVDSYRRLGSGASRLALYHLTGQAARPGEGAFERAAGFEVPSLAALVDAFRGSPDLFALVPRDELAAIDDAFAEAGTRYSVADASSSRLLLLAARLPAGAPDHNPLREAVWRPARDGGGGPPWPPPAIARAVTFGAAVDLIGADLPPSIRRPGSFTLALHLRVHQRPPAGYKIFVHVERPGGFVVGDHAPVGGTFPTAHWRPGDVIRDRHDIQVPLVTAPSGLYSVYVGLWPGGDTVKRLPITAGAGDGRDRALVGTIQVK
jgi:hypothetical protein